MGMKTLCLGAHLGSLNKNLVTHICNLGTPGDRHPLGSSPAFNAKNMVSSHVFQKGFCANETLLDSQQSLGLSL